MRRSATIWQKKSWFDRTAIRRMVKGPVGYGPFSKTVKASSELAKGARREGEDPAGRESRTGDDASVMRNIQLRTNLHLRLSLASLVHPTQLETTPYQSPEWRMAIVRMYRVILRLHNKTVAVRWRGEATSSGPTEGALNFPETSPQQEVDLTDRFMLKYLLNDAQREFGNRFVYDEFHRHTDADHVAASIFYRSWYDYVLQLFSGVTTREMSEDEKRWLTEEQREKLEQLKMAFRHFLTSQDRGHMS